MSDGAPHPLPFASLEGHLEQRELMDSGYRHLRRRRSHSDGRLRRPYLPTRQGNTPPSCTATPPPGRRSRRTRTSGPRIHRLDRGEHRFRGSLRHHVHVRL